MCAVENSPVLFAIIIGLRPKTIGTKQAATTDGSPYLFSTTFFVFFSQRAIFSTVFFLQFSLVPCFQGWTLRLSVTRYFNPLFIYLFTSDTPILIVTYTLLVDPSNIRRRSIVSGHQVSTSSQRGTS